jgi:hypothetical protein
MRIKKFYNPTINSPGDFDWEKTRVHYNLSEFENLQLPTLVKIEKILFNKLGKIISNNCSKPYVFDEVKDKNVQQLINLLYDVRDYIDKKAILN